MPRYKYVGKEPFVDSTYNLFNVQPGQIIETEYFLPDYYENFLLVDIDNVVIHHTESYTIDENDVKEVNITHYQVIQVQLLNPSSTSIGVSVEYPTQDMVTLDANTTSLKIINTGIYGKIYIKSLQGTASVKVYFGLGQSEVT